MTLLIEFAAAGASHALVRFEVKQWQESSATNAGVTSRIIEGSIAGTCLHFAVFRFLFIDLWLHILEDSIIINVFGIDISVIVLIDVLTGLYEGIEAKSGEAGCAGERVEIKVGRQRAGNAFFPVEEGSIRFAAFEKIVEEG